jgi:hypothetical protein
MGISAPTTVEVIVIIVVMPAFVPMVVRLELDVSSARGRVLEFDVPTARGGVAWPSILVPPAVTLTVP